MNRFATALALFLLALAAGAQSNSDRGVRLPEPPMLGRHVARGAPPFGVSHKSPNLTYHNGSILPTTATAAIFWGTSWGNPTFVGDKITGMDSWYQGAGNNNYANTSNEYTGTNGQVTSAISYSGHVIDGTAAPSKAPSTSTILAEVCKMITSPVVNGYYAVYVDTPRGSAGYCAWHSWGSCNGTNVQFAFFFNLDGDAGCDPQSTVPGQSQGLKAIANVSGHELSEARTDPRGDGWYDSSGQENADKCAWTFGSSPVAFSNGTSWKIQGNWSNNAYNAGQGYSGHRGCIDGN